MKISGKSIFSVLLVLAMTLSLLAGCGKKPEPDPSQDNDVSTGVSQDDNTPVDDDTTDSTDDGDDATDESADATDESADATDESADATDESADATDESSDTTTTEGGKVTTKATTTTTKKGQTTTTKKGQTTTTTKKGQTTTTTKNGGIVIDKTTTTSQKTTTTTYKPVVNETTKSKILSMFNESMKGKTATILIHFKANNDTGQLLQMKEETGVSVKFQICDLNDYGTRLSALINASASPDVAYMADAHFPSLIIKGFAQDLSKTTQDITMDIFDKQMMDCFTWNGKKYGLLTKNSADAHFTVTYYNKTIMKRLGVTDPGVLWQQGKWNWDTFLECAKAVNDPNNGVWGCELYASHTFLTTSGKGLITVADGEIINNLGDQAIIDAWNFVNKLHHVDKVTTGLAGAEENFSSGKSVMMVGQTWMWGSGNPVGQTADEWGIVPAPCSPDISPVAIAYPRAAFIPVGCRNPELGLAAYVYWSSNEVYVGDEEEEDDDESTDRTPHYPAEEIEAMKKTLWDMPKVLECSQGIIEYGGEYSQWDFSFDVFQAGISGITANMDKWKSAIDVNIKRIMTEFS